jgi:hypothetical protein
MIKSGLSEEDVTALRYWRFQHPDPRVHVHEARAYLGVIMAGPRLATLTSDPEIPERIEARDLDQDADADEDAGEERVAEQLRKERIDVDHEDRTGGRQERRRRR